MWPIRVKMEMIARLGFERGRPSVCNSDCHNGVLVYMCYMTLVLASRRTVLAVLAVLVLEAAPRVREGTRRSILVVSSGRWVTENQFSAVCRRLCLPFIEVPAELVWRPAWRCWVLGARGHEQEIIMNSVAVQQFHEPACGTRCESRRRVLRACPKRGKLHA